MTDDLEREKATQAELLQAEFGKRWPFLNVVFRATPAVAGGVALEIDFSGYQMGMARFPRDPVHGAGVIQGKLRAWVREILQNASAVQRDSNSAKRDCIMRWASKDRKRSDWIGLT